MAGCKKGAGPAGKEEKVVEKLTNEELEKVSGGKVCLICQPQHEKQGAGPGPCQPAQCQPKPGPGPCTPLSGRG